MQHLKYRVAVKGKTKIQNVYKSVNPSFTHRNSPIAVVKDWRKLNRLLDNSVVRLKTTPSLNSVTLAILAFRNNTKTLNYKKLF